ncbi:MAG TPA: class GN sortase [Marinobacter sp.]|nr:class GN sortase [Marinobacter sp.]
MIRRLLLLVCGLCSVVLMAGLWIPVKAVLAQEMLALAWAESQARQTETRPWPWADTWPVARLALPEQGVSMIVLEGLHGESLAFGPGRMLVGERGPLILAGHRDTHFRHLRHVEQGHRVRLQGLDQRWQEYRVTRARVVDSRREVIDTGEFGPGTLLLVTCYPFDALETQGPLRFVVEARPVNVQVQNDTVAAL